MESVSRMRVMIVEDEPAISDTLAFALGRDGYMTRCCRLCAEAEQYLLSEGADFVILDIGLPDGSGLDFCRRLRTHSQVPVLFLTARGDEIDRIVGLEIGADDYVVKPFSPREVVSRVRSILRRSTASRALLTAGSAVEPDPVPVPLLLDEERLRAVFLGRELALTLSEFRLLKALSGARGRICSRAKLLDALGDAAEDTSERTIDSHIRGLRAKLRAASGDVEPVETHRGTGYSWRGA